MHSALHILMLEDQPEDAALISGELRRAGLRFDARRVDTREAFLREIEQYRPDIILSDHGLPCFDGLTALSLAKRKCPDVPFVFVTGAMGEEFAIKIFENGATDYVLKHHIDELAPAIRRALRRAHKRRAELECRAHLSRNEESYRLLVESVTDYALYMLDTHGCITTWNGGAEQIEGFTAAEAVGKHISQLFAHDPLAAERCEHMMRFAEEHGRYEEEGWRTRRDGSRSWVNVVVTAVRDSAGRVKGFAKVARDITERKQHVEALRRSELRTRAIIETSLDAVVLMDEHGVVHDWNPAAERMFHYKRDDVMGKKMRDLIIPPYLRAMHDKGMARYLTEGHSVILGQRFETVAQRADGTEFPVTLAVAEIPTSGARMFTGYISDITERKQNEEALKLFSQEMEQQVAQRTEQLEAANKELEAFSYSVSHDLRAPLRHINGFVEILQTSVTDALSKDDRRLLNTIADSARHMGKLIDDLLNFSRMGRAELRFVPVELANTVQEALRELQSEARRPGVELTVGAMPTVEGDPPMLRQAFINLIANALKYSRDRQPSRVEIFSEENEREYIIAVRDNGVGFDPAYAHKLFGVFQRLHSPQEFEGTGIGLAIVRRVIARHDGRVWAEGTLERGATFYIALPKRREAQGEEAR
jgi:PAS domain S-box-containing protein